MSESKTTRIHITMPTSLIDLIDEKAKKMYMDRSNWIKHTLSQLFLSQDIENMAGTQVATLGTLPELSEKERLQMAYDLYEQEKENNSKKVNEPNPFIEKDDFIIPTLSVLMCRYCKVRKECHKVVYDDPDGNEEEYFICPDDMNKLEAHQKQHGGTILTVDGKAYE